MKKTDFVQQLYELLGDDFANAEPLFLKNMVVRVPFTYKAGNFIFDCLGPVASKKLIREFGGTRVTFSSWSYQIYQRNQEMIALFEQGLPIRVIAEKYAVSSRTVYRAVNFANVV